METARDIIGAILALREKTQFGVRWPLKESIIATKEDSVKKAIDRFEDIIKVQTNVKSIKVVDKLKGVKTALEPDTSKLRPDFKRDAETVIAELKKADAETVISDINKKDKYELEVAGKKFSIVKEHIIVQRQVPEPYSEETVRKGLVYINKERTKELETEGFAREIMRRVQALRSKAGLEKKDRISLRIKVDSDLKKGLAAWKGRIQDKVGAETVELTDKELKSSEFESKDSIKGKEIAVGLEKV